MELAEKPPQLSQSNIFRSGLRCQEWAVSVCERIWLKMAKYVKILGLHKSIIASFFKKLPVWVKAFE